MDSTNFQHHKYNQQQQQQQHLEETHFVGCSPLNTPSGYGVHNSLHWNNPNNSILSTNTTSNNAFNNKQYGNEFLPTRDTNRPENTFIPDNDARNFSYQSNNLPKIEEDMLSSFPSFGGLINNNPTTSMENPSWFNGYSSSGLCSRGLLHNIPLDDHKDHQSSYNSMSNWSINHGFPNTSMLNQLGLVSSSPHSTTTSVSSSAPRVGLNLQPMDFLGNNNASFVSHSRPMYDVVGEEVNQARKIMMSNKTSALTNGATGTKRAAGNVSGDQPKASTSNNSTPAKKSQLKVSCAPFKVRKEKLGDRIASLHQLVSPFGKTDTASVLTEAIGYIQFLQDQIQTLCMPHGKPSVNKLGRPFQMGPGVEDERKEEARVELGRRGLCLVPLSWTSYISPTQFDASNNNPHYF